MLARYVPKLSFRDLPTVVKVSLRSCNFASHFSECSVKAQCAAKASIQRRAASGASSARWQTRQAGDAYAREAKVAGLKSRAAFKLLQINEKYRIFKPGQTVVDLVWLRLPYDSIEQTTSASNTTSRATPPALGLRSLSIAVRPAVGS